MDHCDQHDASHPWCPACISAKRAPETISESPPELKAPTEDKESE